ncbi:MAG: hypothetical protein JJE22_18280 [Bacteroidia bacterium]|nr:hypothetical protein [Bacteroidia bacterium]
MVQVDISQLCGECNTWREDLRQLRDEFSKDKILLQQAVVPTLSKDQLQNVEHLHNQFHIQLINIHDLKQAIKVHERKLSFEKASNIGQLTDDVNADHESLFEQYENLKNTLSELRNEFGQFLDRAKN